MQQTNLVVNRFLCNYTGDYKAFLSYTQLDNSVKLQMLLKNLLTLCSILYVLINKGLWQLIDCDFKGWQGLQAALSWHSLFGRLGTAVWPISQGVCVVIAVDDCLVVCDSTTERSLTEATQLQSNGKVLTEPQAALVWAILVVATAVAVLAGGHSMHHVVLPDSSASFVSDLKPSYRIHFSERTPL